MASFSPKGTDFKSTDTDRIRLDTTNLVNDIKNGLSTNILQEKYNLLFENYPTMYNLLIKNDVKYDSLDNRLNTLHKLLDKIVNVQNGLQSLDNASSQVSKEFAEKWAPNLLNKD